MQNFTIDQVLKIPFQKFVWKFVMRMYKHVLSNTGRNGKNVKENIFVDSKKTKSKCYKIS